METAGWRWLDGDGWIEMPPPPTSLLKAFTRTNAHRRRTPKTDAGVPSL